MRPVLEFDAELLPQQQAAEAGAVDEQVAANAPVVVEIDRCDVPGLAVLFGADDLALDPLNAEPFSVAPQEAAVCSRVEMVGVGDLRQGTGRILRRMGEAVLVRRGR